MPGQYATKTTVGVDKTKAEIEALLMRYGATRFCYGVEAERALIMFEMRDRRVKIVLPLPLRTDKQFRYTPTGLSRTQNSANEAFQQAIRQAWRALLLVIKAKLEAVEAGISTFEVEFLAHISCADGTTVGDRIVPQLAAISSGQMLPMLPA